MALTRKTTKIGVIHCSDTPETMDIGVEEIDRWHKERGWSKIGYHFVVRRNGAVEYGRKITDVGAHVRGYNSTSIGVCLIGRDHFTDDQWIGLSALLYGPEGINSMYPNLTWVGHRVLDPKKTCPNFDVLKLPQLIEEAAIRRGWLFPRLWTSAWKRSNEGY